MINPVEHYANLGIGLRAKVESFLPVLESYRKFIKKHQTEKSKKKLHSKKL
jgi:hypothetical protein